MITNVAAKLGIDKAIGYTVLSRVIQAGGGVVLILLISLFLTEAEQGYYYTFGSVLAIQIFFELGLNTIITQYVAHEAAHLRWLSPSEISGDPVNISRISSLLRFSIKAFSVLAMVLFVVLQTAGHIFFSKFQASTIQWQIPWQTVAISTSLMLIVNPILAFLEGLGKVKEVARIRLIQQIVNIVAIASALVGKGGLMALGVGSLLSFCVLLGGVLLPENRKIIFSIYRRKEEWDISYWKEIFPYQYKVALSWISGYFIFQLFNPVIFAVEGPVAAGQMGMTWAALNGISALSMSWINTKVPLFSSYIAKKDYGSLDSVFGVTVKQLISVNVILVAGFIAFIIGLSQFGFPLADRFLKPLPIILLTLTVVANQLIFSWATYLRCHKQEPYLVNSLIGGVLCAASTLFLGREFGLMGIVTGYTALTLFVGLPWAFLVFKTKKAEWHSGTLSDIKIETNG